MNIDDMTIVLDVHAEVLAWFETEDRELPDRDTLYDFVDTLKEMRSGQIGENIHTQATEWVERMEAEGETDEH